MDGLVELSGAELIDTRPWCIACCSISPPRPALTGGRHDVRMVQQPVQPAAVSVVPRANVVSHCPNGELLVTIRLLRSYMTAITWKTV